MNVFYPAITLILLPNIPNMEWNQWIIAFKSRVGAASGISNYQWWMFIFVLINRLCIYVPRLLSWPESLWAAVESHRLISTLLFWSFGHEAMCGTLPFDPVILGPAQRESGLILGLLPGFLFSKCHGVTILAFELLFNFCFNENDDLPIFFLFYCIKVIIVECLIDRADDAGSQANTVTCKSKSNWVLQFVKGAISTPRPPNPPASTQPTTHPPFERPLCQIES